LPYSKLYEGLATGLIDVSDQFIDKINLAYMRGSKQRIESLKARRYDFIVLSKLAAEEEIAKDGDLQIVLAFDENTYVSKHKVFLADHTKGKIEEGMRVGIDYTSLDQSKITLYECEGVDVELVSINYMQLPKMLRDQQLDAAIWNADDNYMSENFKGVSFQSDKAKEIAEKATTSVILTEKDRKKVLEYFSKLDKDDVHRIQEEVVNHKKIPHY